jgi:cobalt/nickel transport protein
MKRFATLLGLILTTAALAHFQVLVPDKQLINRPSRINLELLFTHPMANGPVMDMAKVTQFGVLVNGRKTDLTQTLKEKKIGKARTYTCSHSIRRPGDHVFYVEPAPYWEPAEQKMIVHYTKVIVSAMGDYSGWDAKVGFPVEIMPLTRPYGLWTGNAFRGIVSRNGKPVPYAEIEVEYRNDTGNIRVPDDAYETQVIKADANGVFSYVMPKAGWWGFAALVDGDEKMKAPTGNLVDVEIGALMWVQTRDMK